MARHGRPAILNTDQGSQFTGAAFTGTLINHGIAISMAPARAPLIDAENLFRQSGQPQSAALALFTTPMIYLYSTRYRWGS
jgi:transposase InsO family protein